MLKPLVSVIIPTHNSSNYVHRPIRSLMDQSWKNIEILVVDDGSTDNTLDVLEKLCSRDNRIALLPIKKSGVSVARNMGINNSHGEYLLFLDSDDYLEKDAVTNFISVTSLGNIDVIIGGYRKVTEEFEIMEERCPDLGTEDILSGKAVLRHLCEKKVRFYIGNVMFSKNMISQLSIRFTPGATHGEDTEFFWKILLSCNSVVSIKSIILNYVQRDGSTIRQAGISSFQSLGSKLRIREYLNRYSDNKELVKLFERQILWPAYVEIIYFLAKNGFPESKLLDIVENNAYRRALRRIRLKDVGIGKFLASKSLLVFPKTAVRMLKSIT